MPKIISSKEPPSSKTKLFQNNSARAVRFSKALDFDETVSAVQVMKSGRGRLVIPSEISWDEFFASDGVELVLPHRPVL
jgi:antitoxin VapB